MNTQDLINKALDIASEPMRSTLGQTCHWLTFASHVPSGIEVEMGVWGPWNNPTKTRPLENKVALVTGGSSGIGRAAAIALAEAGAAVVIGARRQSEGEAVAEEIRAMGGQATFQSTDVARALVEAYFLAQGYRSSRGSLINEAGTRKAKLLKRGLRLLEGRPGAWTKVAANRGREILLTDTALHLLDLARRFGGV